MAGEREGREKGKGVIYPTLTCFDDAFEYVVAVAKRDKKQAMRLLVVHAVCLLPDGKLGAHAWVEEGSRVVFAGILEGKKCWFKGYRYEYYKEIRPQEMTRYTMEEVLQEGRHTTGPWEEKYQRYTRERKKEVAWPMRASAIREQGEDQD